MATDDGRARRSVRSDTRQQSSGAHGVTRPIRGTFYPC